MGMMMIAVNMTMITTVSLLYHKYKSDSVDDGWMFTLKNIANLDVCESESDDGHPDHHYHQR